VDKIAELKCCKGSRDNKTEKKAFPLHSVTKLQPSKYLLRKDRKFPYQRIELPNLFLFLSRIDLPSFFFQETCPISPIQHGVKQQYVQAGEGCKTTIHGGR